MAQQVKNPTRIHEDEGSIPGLAQWIKNLVLLRDVLWLWIAAAALIQPLAWDRLCFSGEDIKKKKMTFSLIIIKMIK